VAVEALWLVPVLRYPWLGRLWPARTAPMADPEVDPETVAIDPPVPEQATTAASAPVRAGQ
jgi:hypothetical protein